MADLYDPIWKKRVDEWMADNGYDVWDDDDIVFHEGGVGDGRPMSVDDALARPGSNPHRWFSSGQCDLSLYGEMGYIYSALFCAHVVSRSTFNAVSSLYRHTGHVLDVGGTIFTAAHLIDVGIPRVTIVQPPGEQARFYEEMSAAVLGSAVTVATSLNDIEGDYLPVIASEYFEHFTHPLHAFADVANAVQAPSIVFANSFCTPYYGHYNPVFIAGKAYTTKEEAEAAFVTALVEQGWRVRQVSERAKQARRWFGDVDREPEA